MFLLDKRLHAYLHQCLTGFPLNYRDRPVQTSRQVSFGWRILPKMLQYVFGCVVN